MWEIKYFDEDNKIKRYQCTTDGGILSAIEEFYSVFKWKSIRSVERI